MSGRVWALLGSAEFLPWAEEVDRWMLERARPGPVLILPTASAPEGDEVFDGWGRMGVEHYARLGVEAEVLPVKRRKDAERADLASRLDDAAAVFLSGGNPGSLAAALAGTRFWTSLVANLDRGLAYGGCSAGIAALGERAAWRLHRNSFWPGLGVFPGTNVAPHWDAVDAYIPGLAEALVANLGPPFRLVAVDERTAMVGDGRRWSVLGAGGAHILEDGGWTDHGAGSSFDLDLARQPTPR
jgi:cyanophycinase-like exopeptidase